MGWIIGMNIYFLLNEYKSSKFPVYSQIVKSSSIMNINDQKGPNLR